MRGFGSWRRLLGVGVVLAAGGVLAGVLALSAGGRVLGHLVCGQVLVSGTYTLDTDMACPTTHGLEVAAGATVKIVGNGHTIDGDDAGGENGIVVGTGAKVTVENLTIQDFHDAVFGSVSGATLALTRVTLDSNTSDGVEFTACVGCKVTDSTVTDNGGSGLVFVNSSKLQVTGTVVARNGFEGIVVSGGSQAKIEKNTIGNNTLQGVILDGVAQSTVAQNAITGNGQRGVRVTGAGVVANKVVKNHVADNGFEGILLAGTGLGNVVEANTITGNAFNGMGFLLADGTVVRKNVSLSNDNQGIFVFGSDNVLLDANQASENGQDGIVSDDPTTVFKKNTAHINGARGIRTVGAGIDGGGNKARGNAGPAQCDAPIICT